MLISSRAAEPMNKDDACHSSILVPVSTFTFPMFYINIPQSHYFWVWSVGMLCGLAGLGFVWKAFLSVHFQFI